jgi:hypothetical protein
MCYILHHVTDHGDANSAICLEGATRWFGGDIDASLPFDVLFPPSRRASIRTGGHIPAREAEYMLSSGSRSAHVPGCDLTSALPNTLFPGVSGHQTSWTDGDIRCIVSMIRVDTPPCLYVVLIRLGRRTCSWIWLECPKLYPQLFPPYLRRPHHLSPNCKYKPSRIVFVP